MKPDFFKLLLLMFFVCSNLYAGYTCDICSGNVEVTDAVYKTSCCSKVICTKCKDSVPETDKCFGCNTSFSPVLLCASESCHGVVIKNNEVLNHAPHHFKKCHYQIGDYVFNELNEKNKEQAFKRYAVWYCDECDQVFDKFTFYDITAHISEGHQKGVDHFNLRFACTVCWNILPECKNMSFAEMQEHRSLEGSGSCVNACNSCKRNPAWVCSECSETYYKFSAYDIDRHHHLKGELETAEQGGLKESFLYFCSLCNEKGMNYMSYRNHMESHIMKICPDCPDFNSTPFENAQEAINHYDCHTFWHCPKCHFHHTSKQKTDEHIELKHPLYEPFTNE